MVNSADNAYQYVDIGVQTSPRKHVSEARPEHNDIPSARDEPHPESEVERTKKSAKSWIASTRQNDEQSSRAVSHPMPLEGLSVSKINMKSTFYVDGRQSGLESGEISTQRSVSSPGNIGFRVRRSTRASALDIPFRLQSSTNSTDSDDIHTSGSVVYHDSLDTSLTFRNCSPSSSSDSDSIEIIGNQPLSPSLLRNQEKEPGHSQVSFSDSPLIQSGDDGWLQWAHSPPRPIPALHGPLSLPYARCPSGAEGTLLTEPTNVNRVVWGLDEGDRPHLAHSHHADRAPSYTQQHHRWHSRDASQKNIPMSSRKITRTDEMNPVLQNSRQNHGLALLHPAQISHSKRDPSDGKENSVPSDWASAPAFVPKWTSSPTFDSHTTLSTPQFDHSPELSSSIASHSPSTPFLSPSLPSLGPISLSESVINEYLRLDQQYKNVRRQQEILAHRSGPSQLTTPPLSSPTIWNLPFSSEAAHLIATDEQLHDFRDGNPLLTPFAQCRKSCANFFFRDCTSRMASLRMSQAAFYPH
ncbi:hypothetical protein SISNIDRAFT_492744 [Sistotremastrum niveocremeum HHB9708]|uniref:Uncharacterized protein n=1 Tax=Sistotremastrum niveocremeum HHB9708 TaxID=1314777 RepID=A0A165A400_9AGAM|nr:hypothetical protein SISNIDRAFT_492744 [Sistotremastrum niveocremeum HHB9708]